MALGVVTLVVIGEETDVFTGHNFGVILFLGTGNVFGRVDIFLDFLRGRILLADFLRDDTASLLIQFKHDCLDGLGAVSHGNLVLPFHGFRSDIDKVLIHPAEDIATDPTISITNGIHFRQIDRRDILGEIGERRGQLGIVLLRLHGEFDRRVQHIGQMLLQILDLALAVLFAELTQDILANLIDDLVDFSAGCFPGLVPILFKLRNLLLFIDSLLLEIHFRGLFPEIGQIRELLVRAIRIVRFSARVQSRRKIILRISAQLLEEGNRKGEAILDDELLGLLPKARLDQPISVVLDLIDRLLGIVSFGGGRNQFIMVQILWQFEALELLIILEQCTEGILLPVRIQFPQE